MLDVRMLEASISTEASSAAAHPSPNPAWRRSALAFGGFIALVIAGANLGLPLPIFDWVVYLPGGDFGGHLILVGTLALLAGGALPRLLGGVVSTGAAIVALLIAGEEISQLWLEHRSFQASDLLADGLGISLAEIARRGGARALRRGRHMLE